MNLRSYINVIAALALAVLLAKCGSTPTRDGPGKRIDASRIPDAEPRREPVTKAGNKSPYSVFGKTYHVLASSKGYRESGTASWYGSKFHGRNTSNGEVYDMYSMTAAHKTLPIPSYVKVTNLDNGRSAIVRVNDRGPFHSTRIIDLSYAAATKLGYADSGTAHVVVEAIDPASYQKNYVEEPRLENQQPELISGTYLQVGAFGDIKLAQGLRSRIDQLVSQPIHVQQKDRLFKVLIGPISDNLELLSIRDLLQQQASLSAFVVYQ